MVIRAKQILKHKGSMPNIETNGYKYYHIDTADPSFNKIYIASDEDQDSIL
jgi:hypothetical protein